MKNNEGGFAAVTFMIVFMISFMLATVIYLYFGFQKFYLKQFCEKQLTEILERCIVYENKENQYYFIDGKNKIAIVTSSSKTFDEIYKEKDFISSNGSKNAVDNLELQEYISNALKTALVNKLTKSKNNYKIGLLNILSNSEKYDSMGVAEIKSKDYHEKLAESENYIGIKLMLVRVNFTVNPSTGEKEILFNEDRDNAQTIYSNLKVGMIVRFKSPYTIFNYLTALEHDVFTRANGTVTNRAIFDIEYITNI